MQRELASRWKLTRGGKNILRVTEVESQTRRREVGVNKKGRTRLLEGLQHNLNESILGLRIYIRSDKEVENKLRRREGEVNREVNKGSK